MLHGPVRSTVDGMTVLQIHYVTFGVSSSLATLYGGVGGVSDNIKRLLIIPDQGASLRWNLGSAASATTAPWPASGLSLPMDKATAVTVKLYGTGAGTVLEIG